LHQAGLDDITSQAPGSLDFDYFDIRRRLMKLVQSLIVAALVSVPVVSFAQVQQPVTRAEVRAELVQLQKAGYNAGSDDAQYPQDLQAALSRIEATQGSAAAAYGGVANGSSASGSHKLFKHAHSNANAQANAQANANTSAAQVNGFGDLYAHS
jgi:hypothetical protein